MPWLELARECYACGTEQVRGKEVLGLSRSLFGTSRSVCSTYILLALSYIGAYLTEGAGP
jgi:hypothetical protein